MKILIVGSTGMLGNTLKEYLTNTKHDIKTLDRVDLDLSKCSVKDLENKITESNCEVVINCAGLIKQRNNITTTDFIAVNSLLPHRLSEICNEKNIKLIHITTDCVFSGHLGDYIEDSSHDVVDDYGRSKSMGEPKNSTVIRTSIIGEEKRNKLSLLEWVKSHKDTKINGYTNHYWNGLTCLQLSKVIEKIINTNSYWLGVRHIYTYDSVNKYELVTMINEIYELNNEIIPFTPETKIIRTLKSLYDNTQFSIPNLYEQIKETKAFHEKIKNEEIKNYYDNLI